MSGNRKDVKTSVRHKLNEKRQNVNKIVRIEL